MRQRLFCLLVAGIAMWLLTGCGAARFTQPSSLDNHSFSDEVTLSVQPDSLSDQGLVLEIRSHTDQELTYDMWYTVEQYRDGSWYAMDEDRCVPAIAAILGPGQTNEFSVTWDKALPAGRYRVVKQINTSRGSESLAAEFTIS